jgi:hypothetical protein
MTARVTNWPNRCAECKTISHDAEMAKIEFTQILNELNRVEADAAVTDEERQIIEKKFTAPQLDDNVNEQPNQLELDGRSNSANRQSNCYVKRLKTFLLSKSLSDDIEKTPAETLCNYLRYNYSQLRTLKSAISRQQH